MAAGSALEDAAPAGTPTVVAPAADDAGANPSCDIFRNACTRATASSVSPPGSVGGVGPGARGATDSASLSPGGSFSFTPSPTLVANARHRNAATGPARRPAADIRYHTRGRPTAGARDEVLPMCEKWSGRGRA